MKREEKDGWKRGRKPVLAAEQKPRNIEKEGVLKEGERSPGEKKGIMKGLPGEECK